MDGKNGSGSNSGGVVKNRSSSGCLVIKKKPDGPSSSGGRKVYESKKAKKRARVSAGEAVSSEEEELLQYYRSRGGPGGGYTELRDMGFGGNGLMKRSKLDVYDFDEYDDLSDVELMGARCFYGGELGGGGSDRRFFERRMGMELGRKTGGGGSSGMEFEGGTSKGDVVYKRRNSFGGSMSGERVMSGRYCSGKRRFGMENEMGISTGKEKFVGSKDAIRLQGKNGVLKVRVKPKAEMLPTEQLLQRCSRRVDVRGQEISAKNIVIQRHSDYLEKKLPKKPVSIGRTDKRQKNKRKSISAQSSEESGEESEDDESPPRGQSDGVDVPKSTKRGRKGGSLQSPERSQPSKVKEGKVKRGSGTEKQLLREKIRSMLMSAGWTIDYRPRRGRDYFDAVYVNPSGTAYWSIIKAYDALQKQLEEEGKRLKAADDSSSFAPISEDTLSKLTRQTRKKIEKELKRKKREEGGAKRKKGNINRNFEEDVSDTDSGGSGRHDERLSAYTKCSGRPLKCSSKDVCRDGSGSNSLMQERGENTFSMSSSKIIHARKSNKIGRCTLLARNSGKGTAFEGDGFVPYTGKRNLLSWLIDSGAVKLSEKVLYMNRRRTRVMLEGWITKDGIHCGCCSKILSVSKFEIHAASKLRQPFQNTYLSSGASLLQCQVDTWNKQDESLRNGYNKIDVNGDDPNDDTCAMCGDGGNLICCDSCPSTFHQSCLDIQMLPPGDWHCPHCSCKFCGLASVGTAEVNNTKEDTLLTCSLCEGKYHCSCVEVDGTSVNSNGSLPFCGIKCHELFERLQKLLGVKHEFEGGLCWSLIHRTDLGSDNSVKSFAQRVEWNSKLAVALTIMNECFLPIIDRRSGINMIHNVLFNCGSNFTRLNYGGFYCAVLENGDEIVSVASIRIHGTQFAEMPFIGTRHIYRHQGMCRRLFSAIEMALRSLKVEKLIIPAISELMDAWTRVFGFSNLDESDKRKIKTMNMLVFPGTDMLQKKLLDQDGYNTCLAGVGSLEADPNDSDVPGFSKHSDIDSSSGHSTPDASLNFEKINDKSVGDLTSQHTFVSTDEASPNIAHDSDEVQLSLHCSITNITNEVRSPISGDGGLGTTTSLQLDMNLEEPIKDEKDNICPDVNADIHVIPTVSHNPSDSHEVAADCKLIKKDSKTGTDFIRNSGPRNDKSQDDDTLYAETGSSAAEKCLSLLDTSHDVVVIQKSVLHLDNLDLVQAAQVVSDVAYFTKSSDIDASPGACIRDASLENAKLDEKGIGDMTSVQTGVSGEDACLISAPRDISDDVEPLLRSPTSINNEAIPLVSGGVGNNTSTSSLQLEKPMENVVVDIFPDVNADIQVIGNAVDNPASHKESCEADTNMVGVGGPENNECQNNGSLSADGENRQSPLESSHDDVTEKSVVAVHYRDSLEAANHVVHVAGLTQPSKIDSPSRACICDDALDDAKMDDKSITDLTSVHMGVSVEGTSQCGAPQDVCVEVGLPAHSLCNSSEVTPVICDGDRGTTTSLLPLDVSLEEPVENEKDHVSPQVSAGRHVTANGLGKPAEAPKVSVECKLHEASEPDTDIMHNDCPGHDCLKEVSLSSESGLGAGETFQSFSGTSQDDVVKRKNLVAVDTSDISVDKVDDVYAVPGNVDACNEVQSANISECEFRGNNLVCSQASGQSEMPSSDKACCSLGKVSHCTVVEDNSQPDSCDGLRSQAGLDGGEMHGASNGTEIDNEHPLHQSAGEMVANDGIQAAGQSSTALAANNADIGSELQSLIVPDLNGLGECHEPKNVDGDDLCSQASAQLALNGGDGRCSSPENTIHDIIEVGKPQLVSCEGISGLDGQSIKEYNLEHGDIVCVEGTVSLGQISSEISATNSVENSHVSGENPSISTNMSFMDKTLSPVYENDDQGSS